MLFLIILIQPCPNSTKHSISLNAVVGVVALVLVLLLDRQTRQIDRPDRPDKQTDRHTDRQTTTTITIVYCNIYSYLTLVWPVSTLAQTSELVPGSILEVRNPHLRSKMLKNYPRGEKIEKNYYYYYYY